MEARHRRVFSASSLAFCSVALTLRAARGLRSRSGAGKRVDAFARVQAGPASVVSPVVKRSCDPAFDFALPDALLLDRYAPPASLLSLLSPASLSNIPQ
jgi:hypothetical protein